MSAVVGCMIFPDDWPGESFGPFSSHWAACAAMIRLTRPEFRSLGGDSPADLAIEQAMRETLGTRQGCQDKL